MKLPAIFSKINDFEIIFILNFSLENFFDSNQKNISGLIGVLLITDINTKYTYTTNIIYNSNQKLGNLKLSDLCLLGNTDNIYNPSLKSEINQLISDKMKEGSTLVTIIKINKNGHSFYIPCFVELYNNKLN